jgi:phosphoglycerate dehydrogenase-like enzyme
MNQPSVLVLTLDAEDYLPWLDGLAATGVSIVTATSAEEALALASPPPILLARPDLAATVLDAGYPARWIQSTWAGVLPLLATGRRDVVVTGVKGVFGPQIAEYVIGHLLAFELRLLERLGRQAARQWWPEPAGSLAGKTLGVMGTGSIGRHLARVAGAFGLVVIGLNRGGAPTPGFERTYPTAELDAFLGEADYIACTLPETPETADLLDAAAFAAMKPGCYLVNVGRGSLVDENALLQALASGRLSGASLDVFREEPLPAESPLWHADNTLVSAHVAARSRPGDIARLFCENYGRWLRGENLKHRVDFDRGY